jgi:hypothetical protein
LVTDEKAEIKVEENQMVIAKDSPEPVTQEDLEAALEFVKEMKRKFAK